MVHQCGSLGAEECTRMTATAFRLIWQGRQTRRCLSARPSAALPGVNRTPPLLFTLVDQPIS
jgi:hypothetical protein